MKEWRKIFPESRNKTRAGVVTLDKMDFEPKTVTRDKKIIM